MIGRALFDLGPQGIVAAYLFGSYAEERSHRESDVDIGVILRYDLYPSRRARFEERLRLSSALSVALHFSVDLVILNDAPASLGRRIVTTGVRVFSADKDREHSFIRDIQLRAADLEPFLRRMRALKLQALGR
jgi:predicted nucleotidyltransferase